MIDILTDPLIWGPAILAFLIVYRFRKPKKKKRCPRCGSHGTVVHMNRKYETCTSCNTLIKTDGKLGTIRCT